MIHTVSVIKGYISSLGFCFLNIAFFFAMIIGVSIPSADQLEPYSLTEEDMFSLYFLQLFTHLLSATITFLLMNQHWKQEIIVDGVQYASLIGIISCFSVFCWQFQTLLMLI